MDPFNQGPSDLEKHMESDIGAQLQVISTNNTWVPLDSLIPKINQKFKKFNANIPKPTEFDIPIPKKPMTNTKSVVAFLEEVTPKELNQYGIFLIKMGPDNYMIFINPPYGRMMLNRIKKKGTKAGSQLPKGCDCPRYRHENQELRDLKGHHHNGPCLHWLPPPLRTDFVRWKKGFDGESVLIEKRNSGHTYDDNIRICEQVKQ